MQTTQLAESLKQTREALASGDDNALLAAIAVSRRSADEVQQSRGIFGRLFGIDPATVYLIVQLALLVIELVRKFRELRNAK